MRKLITTDVHGRTVQVEVVTYRYTRRLHLAASALRRRAARTIAT